jgi:hypothetical protein
MNAKPRLKSAFNVTLQLAGEILMGLVFGAIGAYIGYNIYKGDLFDLGKMPGLITGFLVCYPIGVFLGIYSFGRVLKIEGTMLESFMGIGGATVLFLFFAEPLGFANRPHLLFASFLALFPLFGTMGYYYKLK